MGENEVSATTVGDIAGTIVDFSVDSETLDSAEDQKETRWSNQFWTEWLGYYINIPEYNTAVNAKAKWTVGRGYDADELTLITLGDIKGFGFDTFTKILENCIRTYQIGGDSYCEIIKDDDGNLINLKPLNPERMVHIINSEGMFERFEQTGTKKGDMNKELRLDQVFYLPRNRIGDQVHGTSVTEKLTKIILSRNEAMNDYKEVMHRFVKPRWIIKLDTDDPTKIAAEKVKWDTANANGENMYVPMGAVEPELMSVAPNATINPQAWIESLNDYFFEACEVPKIIVGNSKNFTDAASKISYLTFEQNVREEQLFIEEQVLAQLNLEIKLKEPASLEGDLLTSGDKEGDLEATQPNDLTAETEGNT